ncbi:hypothetical protein Mmar10_1435 [Maricaulis maris MCS10]|uniref:Shedu protein SduA C-terminal domain-containing protein n=2 Tax=Maricaulis maris TaxID=74318 RepID=Q0APR0_MARMM|nr:hypothetical protein Mmar10_1435 [Maricaulis maris MCS10]
MSNYTERLSRMIDENEHKFFRARQATKTYISKVFSFDTKNPEPVRKIRMVLDGSDELYLGEIEGAMCLRLTGNIRKTQITALVTQDDKKVERLSLLTFKNRAGDWLEAIEEHAFTFRANEFNRLLEFLEAIKFVDLSNEDNFHIEDISTQAGHKAIIDGTDRVIVDRVKKMSRSEREEFLKELRGTISKDEVNILLGRKDALQTYSNHLKMDDWAESEWQDFFEKEPWVFGYGLDYRVMRQFDREMTVGSGGTDNKNKPVVDFLMTFTDYTALVEIKKPSTPIFRKGRGGRAGTWEFSREFTSAVSQVLEQKAEWLSFAQVGQQYNHAGNERLAARTRNAKTILVVGSLLEFNSEDRRSADIKRDTFELFRRENRSLEIVTFDELLDRAQFIVRDR